MLDDAYYEKRQKILQTILNSLAEMGYDFCQFDRQHRNLYLKYEPHARLSCRCFLSQYAYAKEDCIFFREDQKNGCLLMFFLDDQNGLCAYPPLFGEYTPERFASAVETIRAMFTHLGFPIRFRYADEEDVARFSKLPCSCEISAPLYDADYIYEFEKLKDFRGRENTNRRRKHNHFMNRNSVALECIHAGNKAECTEVLSAWCEAHDCTECRYRCPRNVAMRVLDAMDELNTAGYLFRVNGTAQAVILLGQMSADMLDVITICSINREMGAEETLYALIADAVSPPYTYMNLEEDMGIEGIRTHKQSMHPCRMQNKYVVSLL